MKVKIRQGMHSGLSHEERIAAANEFAKKCLLKHGKKIAAIGVYGTTAIAEDLPYSDLDITVLTNVDLDGETKCYPYRGIPVTIDYQTVRETIEVEAKVPGEGGCWLSFMPVYDPDHTVERLRRKYRSLNSSDFRDEFLRRMGDRLLTYIGKVRNSVILGDRAYLIRSAQDFGTEACRALGVLNHDYVTGQAMLREETKRFPRLPRDFSRLIDAILGTSRTSDQQLYDSCEALWTNMLDLSRKNGTPLDLGNRFIHA